MLNAEPPFRYCRLVGKVMGKNAKIGGDTLVCDVRGWGYLTGQGHGALGLPSSQARQIMDDTGELIAALLNAHVDAQKEK